MLPTAGPLSVALVIAAWAMLLATGFALIYWSTFPADYTLPAGAEPAGSDGWWWSFYYSLEMMTTLGLGDLRAEPDLAQIAVCLPHADRFFLRDGEHYLDRLVFPALRRIRTLARKASTLSGAEARTGVSVVSAGMHVVLAGLAEEVIRLRVDFVHFPLLFYFYAQDSRASLPPSLFSLMRFANDGAEAGRDDLVRLAAIGLSIALHDLADLIGERLDCKDRSPDVVFQTFAELHTV